MDRRIGTSIKGRSVPSTLGKDEKVTRGNPQGVTKDVKAVGVRSQTNGKDFKSVTVSTYGRDTNGTAVSSLTHRRFHVNGHSDPSKREVKPRVQTAVKSTSLSNSVNLLPGKVTPREAADEKLKKSQRDRQILRSINQEAASAGKAEGGATGGTDAAGSSSTALLQLSPDKQDTRIDDVLSNCPIPVAQITEELNSKLRDVLANLKKSPVQKVTTPECCKKCMDPKEWRKAQKKFQVIEESKREYVIQLQEAMNATKSIFVDAGLKFFAQTEQNEDEVYSLKKSLEEANVKCDRLESSLTQIQLEYNESSCNWVKLEQDYLLCVRSAERFRAEAVEAYQQIEQEKASLANELEALRAELSERELAKEVASTPLPNCTGQTLRDFTNKAGNEPYSEKVDKKIRVVEQQSEQIFPISQQRILVSSAAPSDLEEELLAGLNKENCKAQCSGSLKENEKLQTLRKNSGGSLRNALLKWCQTRTKEYPNVDVTNFSSSWKDGMALCALIHSAIPTAFDYSTMSPSSPATNFQTAVDAAKMIGVKYSLDVQDILTSETPSWENILSYVSEIYTVLDLS